MNFNLLFNYVILLVFNLLCYIKCSEQPKISIKNGNIEFSVGEDRHIYFKTKGEGFVHVNGNRIGNSENQELSQHLELLEDKLNKVINTSAELNKTTVVSSVNETTIKNLHTRLYTLEKYIHRFKQLEELLNQNECHNDPCANGAQCIDLFNDYMCLCPNNWEGKKCDKDVNECVKFAGTDLGCQHDATCINKPGTYECICQNGWVGLHCTQQTANCTTANPQELCGHGVCVPQSNEHGYTCICEQGWKTTDGHPACTVDVDECATSVHCSTNPPVRCINLPGSFACGPCPVGYEGNGQRCVDINECLRPDNGGCSISPHVTCINTIGSRVCGPCPPGYSGDGVTCSNMGGACGVNNGGCNKLARCVDYPAISDTYVQCICPQGYTGQGFGLFGCSVINTNNTLESACKSNPCRNHGTCTEPSPGKFKCTCGDYFVGLLCHIIDPCLSKPCMNGATCTTTDSGTFICTCLSNYEGRRCEDEKQACGGVLRSPTGNLTYPSSGSSVSQSKTSCGWTIETNSSLILNVTFLKFDLSCNEEWLQLHDGKNSAAHVIGRFCGSHHPPSPLLTTHGYLYLSLKLHHNRETKSEGNIALSWHSIAPICGVSDAVIPVDKHGTLESPGSPGSYPPKRDCQWHLQARPGKRIKLNFSKMKLVTEKDCSDDDDKDYLEIRENPTDSSVLIKFCRSSQRSSYTTPGNEAFVMFHSADIPRSSNASSIAGFKIDYDIVEGIPGCGGTFTAKSSVIKYPSNTEDSGSNEMVCEYLIQLPSDFRVKLIFEEISLHASCRASKLEVLEGSQINSPLALRFCDTKTQTQYISNSNEVMIMYEENFDEKANNNFKIRYESICGGSYTGETGIITSPNYPNPYPFDVKCVYSIETPEHTAVKLIFNEIMLDVETENCDTGDYIQVRDGDSDESPILNTFCGNRSNIPIIISMHNIVTIVFKSDNTISGRGFEVKWISIDVGCGGIKKKEGILESPKSVNIVKDNMFKGNKISCLWTLIAPPGNVVKLTWNSFNLYKIGNCEYKNFVEIYNNAPYNDSNSDGTSQLLGRFCGTTLPPTLISSSNVMTVVVLHDLSQSYSAAFTFSDQSHVCGGIMLLAYGVIRSPGYADNIPQNKDCTWIIQVQTGYQIELNVTAFDIMPSGYCRYDFLEIRNGGYETSPLIGKFCGFKIPPVFTSHSNELYVRFHSIGYFRSRFELYWTTSLGCGAKLSSSKSHLVSPGYPKPHSESAECDWSIATSAGSLVQIIMINIELGSHSQCRYNYVEFYNVIKNSKKSIGRYCNDHHPPFITSNSNQMLIKFRTARYYEQKGFEIKYVTVCNNTIKGLYHGVIESPNYPNQCSDKLDCMWVINVPNRNKINIIISHLVIEDKENKYVHKPSTDNSTECSHDYIEISEGEDEKTPVRSLRKLCDSKIPDSIIASSTNFVFVHFVTDTIDSKSKFRLEWMLNSCGGKLTHPNGVVKSPNYPSSYLSGTVCEWVIEVDFGKSIVFTVHDIRLENCDSDALSVYGGPDINSLKIADFCNDKNKTITSSFNSLYVRFYSNSLQSGRGFSASYKTVPIQCGGLNTASTGSIHSRNYPQIYKSDDDCRWLIQVPESYKINLTFVDFNLETSINCTHDFVKVYDGGSIEDEELLSHCGNKLPDNSVILSSSNKLTVQMKTDNTLEFRGFQAMYTEACGRRIVTNGTGIIEKHEQASHVNCSWTILTGIPEEHVYLTINHIEEYIPAYNIYKNVYGIFVYDGEDSEAPLINNYHKGEHPTIVSKGDALHIVMTDFVTRFAATYSDISTSCGGQLTSSEGSFASPGYPDNYPINVDCEWLIKPSLGNNVKLRFSDFKLAPSEKCNEDYVELREESALGKLIGVFCGSEIPNLGTSGYAVGQKGYWIKFKSNEDDVEKGFSAVYEISQNNELTGSKGRIQSPLYPLHYLKASRFTWRIIVHESEHIRITFSKFTIDSLNSNKCHGQVLKIYDGYESNAQTLSKICGHDLPHPVTSSSNEVFIEFITYRSEYGSLFDLEWLAIPQTISEQTNITDCGSNEVFYINGIHNYTLTSPGYPHGYGRNLKCDWIFATVVTEHIVVEFNKLDLETSKNCGMDAVRIYSGSSEKDWTNIGTYCHPNLSKIGKIHGTNFVKIVFASDGSVNKTGFSAKVYSVCGGSLEGPMGVIDIKNYTLNKDSMYYFINGIECKWNITVKPGRKIKIKFDDFDMGGNENCKQKYIMFKNGKYEDSPLLGNGKYCGNTKPDLPLTTGNTMNIVFHVNTPIKSLKLVYEEVPIACRREIVLSNLLKSHEITTPNYPNVSPPYIECVWIVTVPAEDSVQLDFLEHHFDISNEKECANAGVEIRDGANRQSLLKGVFCTNIPGTQTVSGNHMYIRYYTNIPYPGIGFKANVSIVDCQRTIVAEEGVIHSPNTNDIKKTTTCTWNIIGPLHHALTFTVMDFNFNVPVDVNCSLVANVLIKEKDFINYTDRTLEQLCGNKKPDPIKTLSNKATIEFNSAGKDWPSDGSFIISFNSTEKVCGEEITDPEGFLTSPGYPSGHFETQYCEWTFEVPAGRRIKFQLLDIDFDTDFMSHEQFLEFYNFETYESVIIHKESPNKVIHFTGNTISVLYISREGSQHRGFKLKYSSNEPSLCEGDLNQQSGTITPSLALYNETSYFCQWTQTENDEESNQTLALTFIINGSIGSTESHNCEIEMSNILVIDEVTSDTLLALCGTYSKPVVVLSPFRETIIQVTQSDLNPKLNYTINYTKYPCGGYFSEYSLTITSNNYPRPYKNNIDCAWMIAGPEGENYDIIFETLDMDTSCENNYLSIHNGPLPSSPTLGKFCGNIHPNIIRSGSNKLWIEYHAIETTAERKGFKINLNSIQSGCGGVYHNIDKMIMSPDFPTAYPDDSECVWEVIAPNGYHIGLEFIDRFQIEQSVNCTNDFIEVWDYVDESWKSLGRACGRNPPSFNSTSNKMKIMFRSNSAISGNGFKAKWHMNCGGVFYPDEEIRTIVSPNYPNMYANNLYCKYTIASGGNTINVLFTDFELEKGCQYDNITISTANNKNVYCNDIIPQKIHGKNSVEIVFHSDSYVSKRGFSFIYQIDRCGGKITKPKQIGITLTHDIDEGIDCIWNITAPEGKIVVVKFSTLELDFYEDCIINSVAIYNGNEISDETRLTKFCGDVKSHSIHSTSNSMVIELKSLYVIYHPVDFKASVMFTYGESSGCGGIINLSENKKKVTIKSPNITEDGLYLDCIWQVSAPLGSNIKMSFKTFDVSQCIDENSADCNCDYLEVLDGPTPYSESILKTCGHNIPVDIMSSFHNLWIQFVSIGANKTRNTGFTADVELISICGNLIRNVTNSTQVLMSPNYPLKYPPNTRCKWYLYSENEHTIIDIHFEFLDLEEANSEGFCTNDKIEIDDENALPSINDRLGSKLIHTESSMSYYRSYTAHKGYPVQKHTFCGKNKPDDYYSGGNNVVIKFTSNSAKEFKGFKITYSTAGCNRNFTEIQGRIHNKHMKGDCFITITVPENRTISVFFQSFNLLDTKECTSAALVVRDGLTTDAQQLDKLCGVLSPNPIFSTGNTLSFEIWNRQEDYGDYDIIYSSTDQGQACGGTLYNYVGVLSSPFYPGNPRNATDCMWHIFTPDETVVWLKFTTFNLGPSCETDYVELLDVNPDTMDSEVRVKYCGDVEPAIFRAERNAMTIRTVSSVNNGGTGWMAKYIAEGPKLRYFR